MCFSKRIQQNSKMDLSTYQTSIHYYFFVVFNGKIDQSVNKSNHESIHENILSIPHIYVVAVMCNKMYKH